MADSAHSIPKPDSPSPGMQRQFEIYQLGLAGKKLSIPIPVSQLESKAAEVLTPQAYDYVAGSASGVPNAPDTALSSCRSRSRHPSIEVSRVRIWT